MILFSHKVHTLAISPKRLVVAQKVHIFCEVTVVYHHEVVVLHGALARFLLVSGIKRQFMHLKFYGGLAKT